MKLISTLALVLLFVSHFAISETLKPWSYSGLNGPDYWASLNENNELCAKGRNQSPVNLSNFVDIELSEIKFDYSNTGYQIENDGHNIVINSRPGSSIWLNEKNYKLEKIMLHTPSEHLIGGKGFPLEVQLYHINESKKNLVISVMFEEGGENEALNHDWKSHYYKKHSKHLLYKEIKPNLLIPNNKQYYQYSGSLTTPPCSEGVDWLIMKHTVQASTKQIESLNYTIHSKNNRPVQNIGSRKIYE